MGCPAFYSENRPCSDTHLRPHLWRRASVSVSSASCRQCTRVPASGPESSLTQQGTLEGDGPKAGDQGEQAEDPLHPLAWRGDAGGLGGVPRMLRAPCSQVREVSGQDGILPRGVLVGDHYLTKSPTQRSVSPLGRAELQPL